MKEIKKNYKLLEFLSTCKPGIRDLILANADKSLINVLCECVLNVLNGTVKLENSSLNKIKKHKDLFRKMACKNKSIKQSHKALKQNGSGWITLLIPPILEAVRNIFNN